MFNLPILFLLNATYETIEVCHLNALFLVFCSSCLHSSFPGLTTQHVATQLTGFVGSYCTLQKQHRLQWLGFYYLSDRDLLFAHVQTSAGLLFCFMTISAVLPWHQGLWPHSLILSGVSKFQTLAESFLFHIHSPKCCHSRFPGHQAPWVQGRSGDLQERETIPRLLGSNNGRHASLRLNKLWSDPCFVNSCELIHNLAVKPLVLHATLTTPLYVNFSLFQ